MEQSTLLILFWVTLYFYKVTSGPSFRHMYRTTNNNQILNLNQIVSLDMETNHDRSHVFFNHV